MLGLMRATSSCIACKILDAGVARESMEAVLGLDTPKLRQVG